MRKNIRNSVIALLMVICVMLSQGTAFAAYNTRPDKMYPQLMEVEIASGDSPDAEIHLKFSNNVGAISEIQEGRYDMIGINEENLTRFSMVAADDEETPVEITVTPHPEAAMHTDESKYFFIFANELDVNQEYIITVDKDLYANMGNSLAVDYQVRFTIATGDISFEAMGELPEETPALPLYFTKANIENNATNVELDPTITMAFAFNIAGPEVLEFNKTCISLMKGSDPVPIEILASENVKEIIIHPIDKLEPATEYRLVVTKDLMARNGNTLSSPVNLYFTTRANKSSGGSHGHSGSHSSTDTSGNTNTPTQPKDQGQLYFSDIKDSWALADITWLADRGIVSGNPNGEFLPENTITRAEMVTILARAFDLCGDDTVSFQDVTNHWASAYISAAVTQGIVSGVGNGLFEPDSIVTREQLAVMIVRAGELSAGGKEPIEFTDNNQVSAWASEAVKIASINGVTRGYPDGTFRPGQDVTRAEACRMMVGLLKLKK